MGKRLFYPRLACANLRKNHSIYRPYLLAVVLLSAMYYCLRSVAVLVAESGAAGGGQMSAILDMSGGVIGFLSVLVLFYANSFLLRRRQREFGLYSVLGLEKRHICRVMVWEVLLVALGGTAVGMAAGALFSQLFLLLLQRLSSLPVLLTFRVPGDAVGSTAALFAAAFLLVLGYDVLVILRGRPVELLRGAARGEREPKARWLLALLGAATLGGGYYMALTVRRPVDALLVFFPAVLLVIAGTYLLFLAGSIAILKLLRKNKRFYYRPRNFISVSTLLYRMKQNAAGLASICILSTCVLVTLSSTVCLFLGEEDSVRRMYPRMVNAEAVPDGADRDALVSAVQTYTESRGGRMENLAAYRVCSGPVTPLGGGVYESTLEYNSESVELLALTAADYNACAGTDAVLGQDQILLFAASFPAVGALQLDGWTYAVAEVRTALPEFLAGAIGEALVAVVPDDAALDRLMQRGEAAAWAAEERLGFDVAGVSDRDAYYAGVADCLRAFSSVRTVEIRDDAQADFYQIYGSLLFVGLFFTALFLIAVVLILYYKQITEGFDDHDRFRILQNVGMSRQEVRGVISRQVLLMFYLPLAVALVHIAVAFPVLCKLLQAFQLYNTRLFLACTAAAAGLFLLFYLLTYKLTARTYYKIVHV